MRKVSVSEAVSAAKDMFKGKDVDYYYRSDPCDWLIFVDAEPMKGWEHDCYLLHFPQITDLPKDSLVPSQTLKRRVPPEGSLRPYLVKNRYGVNSQMKPKVVRNELTNSPNPVADRTYAIILSGGINPNSNKERYWNDCSFIYQTLVNKYGIPKENVIPIMSDGDNPAVDMKKVSGEYVSQPLDLDNDGVQDIKLAATVENIESTLSSLAEKMGEDDHLLFYVIDHGGTDDYINKSYICLWNNQKLYDDRLAELLQPFTEKLVNVNVVLGQCYSGGFVDDLTDVGCVVSAASTGSESSWGCPDIPFDEFVYQWTCAVNEADHKGNSVVSDTDGNGRVTMLEAFEYAKSHDRRTYEHPQYVSNPISVGEDLAFNHLAPAIDLYIQDDPEDTGTEPNVTIDKFWLSPSIWIRNKDDNVYEHENPYYSENHTSAVVNVRIHNRGKVDYDFNKLHKFVHFFWAKASTIVGPRSWVGKEYDTEYNLTGGPLSPQPLKCIIPAGGYASVKTTWALPIGLIDASTETGFEKHHFCIFARIMDTVIPVTEPEYFVYDNKAFNDMAQVNISIVDARNLNQSTAVYVRNTNDSTSNYTLEIVPNTVKDESIYSHAKIEMAMSDPVYSAWERGGLKSVDVEQYKVNSQNTVRFNSKMSRLEAVSLKGREFDKVNLKFRFKGTADTVSSYTVDLIQRNEAGEILGGETFIVKVPYSVSTVRPIDAEPVSGGVYLLKSDADSNESVWWEDSEGRTIGEGRSITVTPQMARDNTYKAYVISEDGEVSTGSVTLDLETGIERIETDDRDITMNVMFKSPVCPGASVTVSGVSGSGQSLSCPVEEGKEQCSVDISSLVPGVYAVSCVVDGTLVDSVKFVKK